MLGRAVIVVLGALAMGIVILSSRQHLECGAGMPSIAIAHALKLAGC